MSTYSPEERAAIEADNARDIDAGRTALNDALAQITVGLRGAYKALDFLTDKTVYDVELAEGGDRVARAALTQIEVAMGSLAHHVPPAP